MDTNFERIRRIFLEIVEQPATRWEMLLNEACAAEEGLQRQVAVLLQAHARENGILDRNQAALTATGVFELGERPGAVIGPYMLVQQIGEGGMGVVWMAEQTEPVRRTVALKVIKPGMDSGQVVARFEAERQALALMDHVNIATVFDGGTSEAGRPYFVMELVHGVPITRYCDDNRLTPRQRLELFVPVCQAIQHAHQKGIIHRDVKASNVLITRCDGKPVPKVIDFGVAKAIEQKLTERTLCTQSGTLVGTLEYMSPEQAEMSAQGVDTRSDIYSLGVLLYELLTGSTPLSRQQVKEAGYAAILYSIREQEPPRPSVRLRESESALAAIAAQRRMEPAKLVKLVRGELDWIVMKALEKDRNRRYETANGLAADVERYLADEPVQACPPSKWYQFQKLARRNRRVLAMAGVIGLALVLGTAISVWQAVRATDAEVQGRHRLFEARVAQAKAGRFSHRIGQRFDTLDAVAQAAQIARDLKLPEEQFLELRNIAIAALALPDLRVVRQWNGWHTDCEVADFDSTFARYAWTDRQGVCSVWRSADGSLVARLPPAIGIRVGDGSGAEPILSRDGRYVAVVYHPRNDFAGLRMWKLDGDGPVLLVDKDSQISAFGFSPCGRLFGFGVASGPIQLLDLASGRLLPPLNVGPNPQWLTFHANRRQFAVHCNGKIRIAALDSDTVLAELPAPTEGVDMMEWHPRDNLLAVSGRDRKVHLWDVATRTQTGLLEGHKGDYIRIAFNHGGDLLASMSWDRTVRLWAPQTGQQVFQTQADLRALRFSSDDQWLAAGIDRTSLCGWEVAPALAYRTLVREPILGRGEYATCATSSSGRLAVIMPDGVGLWDLQTGKPLTVLPLSDVVTVLFEPSGALLTYGPAGLLRWPLASDAGAPGRVRIGPPQRLPLAGSIAQCARSLDGRVLASAQYWGGLVWHQDLAAAVVRLAPHEDTRFIDVSPDGHWVATGTHWGTKVKIWEARTGKLVRELPVERSSPVRFSSNGRWLATSGEGCRLWAVDGWTAGPHIGDGPFAFSPDGKLLAVETGYGVVRLVNPDTGSEYARLEDPNQDRSHALVFSADGAQLVTTNGDSRSIHIWDLRRIREELAPLGLDWDLPPYPPANEQPEGDPPRLVVDLGSTFAKGADRPPEPKRPPAPTPRAREAWRQEMQRRAKALKVARKDGNGYVAVELLPAVLYRYNEPAHDLYEATLWGWGDTGRPVALAAMEFYAQRQAGARAMYELVSLADGPIKADGGTGRWHWSPKQPGVVLQKFPTAAAPPAVADAAEERLKQITDLANRMTAFVGRGSRDGEGTGLRLLPKPLHRYAEPKSGLLDGALFVFARDTNPEVVLLVEARGHAPRDAAWHYGLARLSADELSVRLDGAAVWTQFGASLAPHESYWIAVQPYTPR